MCPGDHAPTRVGPLARTHTHRRGAARRTCTWERAAAGRGFLRRDPYATVGACAAAAAAAAAAVV